MNRVLKILCLLGQGIVAYLYIGMNITIPCLFLKIFHLQCPCCGMTRAFLSIFKLNFLSAIHYNLLSIPLFIVIVISDALILYDIVTNQTKINSFFQNIVKYDKIIIIVLVMNMLINNLT